MALSNNDEYLISSASVVSVSELRIQRRKLKICIPSEANECMLMLKRYSNLVYTTFSEACLLFKLLREVIQALHEFSREAQKRTTMSTKGSILWITLLQSQQFALGEMNVLCKFTMMHSDLRAKMATIHHSEIPMELITNSAPQVPPTPPPAVHENPGVDVDKIPKKLRVSNPNNWNPKLKTALQGLLGEAGNPTFTKVMDFYKKDAYSIVPKGYPVCAPNLMFGSCFFDEKCTKKHTMATDAQLQPVLELVNDFVKEPKKLALG